MLVLRLRPLLSLLDPFLPLEVDNDSGLQLVLPESFSWFSAFWRSEGMNCMRLPWSGPLLLLLLLLILPRNSSFC